MNINSVSFGNQDFNALVAEPPTSGQIAAAGMYEEKPDSFEKSSSGTVAKTVIGLGVAAAVLAALRGKVGTFSKIDLEGGLKAQEGITAKAKYVVAKAGQAVIDAAKKVQGLFSKKAKLENVNNKITELNAQKTSADDALKAANEKLAKATDDAAKAEAQKAVDEAQAKVKDIETKLTNLNNKKTDLEAKINGKAEKEAPEAAPESKE